MKRSEMVQIILKELQSDDLTGDLLWVAQHIVSLCEENGMLPPEIQTDIWCRSENDFFMKNEWESEEK